MPLLPRTWFLASRACLVALVGLAACGVRAQAGAPVRAPVPQAEAPVAAGRPSAEAQLQAIREALIDKAMGASTRVSATSWVNERGELMEASQFRTDMQVRGVRVLEYLSGQEPRAVVDTQAASSPGQGAPAPICRDPADGQPWRHPVSLRVQALPPLDPEHGFLAIQAARWAEATLRGQAQAEGAVLDGNTPAQPRNRYEEALWSAPRPRTPFVLSLRVHVLPGRSEGLPKAQFVRWEARAREWMGWAEGDRQDMTVRMEWTLGRTGEAAVWQQTVDLPMTAMAQQRPGRQWNDQARGVLAQEAAHRWQTVQGVLDCEPLMLEARGFGDGQITLLAGQDAGLRVGDRLVLVDGRHVPRRLLEADAAPHLALLEVHQVQAQRAQARQVAGPRLALDSAAQWWAMPYGSSWVPTRTESGK